MSAEPDILEGFPDLLAIAERLEGVRVERSGHDASGDRLIQFYVGQDFCGGIWCPDKHAEAIGGLSADLATLLAAVRSLIQQTRDLRADEGELSYEVLEMPYSIPRGKYKSIGEALAGVAYYRRFLGQRDDWGRINTASHYEIVAVRRHVVQTVQAGKE